MNKLSEFQSKLKAPKGQFNKFGNYKYRSAEDIVEAVKPIINPAGFYLHLTDEIVQVGDRYYVKATATITNGEISFSASAYAREEETKKGMDASQITGAASSYARKYALNGLFAIDDTKDADATNEHKDEPKTEKKLPELTPKDEAKWNKAAEYVASHGLDRVLTKYYISEENQDLLLSHADMLHQEANDHEHTI